jgi:CubicO group peptidase (beta-lactamase class C family)
LNPKEAYLEPLQVNLPHTTAIIQEGIASGLHVGAQIHASLDGRVVADLAIGFAQPDIPMRLDTLIPWLSCSKPIGAVAIGQLWERGKLTLDDPVSTHIPEFAVAGKDGITIRHLLTHTAGIRPAASPWEIVPWDTIIRRICAAPVEPGWTPGKKAGYHLASSWFILGELVRRLDGRPYETYVRDEIFFPLGMTDSWLAIPPDQYQVYGDRIGQMYDTSHNPPRVATNEQTQFGAGLCNPGASARGSARDLCRFYEMLLAGGALNGKRILLPQTVEALTAPHRRGMFDHTFQHVMDWGLGFMVDNKLYGPDTIPYPFAPQSSPRTFGHGGSRSSISFADPERGLATAIILNGRPGEHVHQPRMRGVLAALEQDLASQ